MPPPRSGWPLAVRTIHQILRAALPALNEDGSLRPAWGEHAACWVFGERAAELRRDHH